MFGGHRVCNRGRADAWTRGRGAHFLPPWGGGVPRALPRAGRPARALPRAGRPGGAPRARRGAADPKKLHGSVDIFFCTVFYHFWGAPKGCPMGGFRAPQVGFRAGRIFDPSPGGSARPFRAPTEKPGWTQKLCAFIRGML